jgi:hypothetical protein
MKVAHILLVHQYPLQVERLINSMQYPDSVFFLHVDLKTDITPYLHLKNYPSVYFIENRIKVYWGGFSQIKAIINSIQHIVSNAIKFDYINLVSGQDYPIKPIDSFFSYLEANPNKCFMEFVLPGDNWLIEAQKKLNTYNFVDMSFKGQYFLERVCKLILPKRKPPGNYVIVGRSTWFTMDIATAQYLLDRFKKPDPFINFFKYCWGSDEILFHTLLYNSPYKDKMVNNNLRYIEWVEGKARPEIFTVEDAGALTKSNAFLARKFDMSEDAAILDYVDQNLLTTTIG